MDVLVALPMPVKCVIAVFGGALAGFINTLAGNGSAITLPLLMFLGLDPHQANGTNRVGVVLSSTVGAYTFHRHGLLDTQRVGWFLVPMVAGGMLGALITKWLDASQMKLAIVAVMVLMFVLVVAKPNRWIKEDARPHGNQRSPITLAIFFATGMYGGFIQAGVGILTLAALVLRGGYDLKRANPIKVLVIAALTIPALGVFIGMGQVNWALGFLMASGQMTGAFIAAKFAAHHPNANVWVRRLLIVIIIAVVTKLLMG